MRVDSAYEGCLGFKHSIRGRLSGDNLNLRRQVSELMNGLKWQFRIQDPFYDVMTCLAAKKLQNPDALHSDIEWKEQSKDVLVLISISQDLEVAEQCSAMGMDQLHGSFHGPVGWLASTNNSSCDYRHQRRRLLHHNLPHSWRLRQRPCKRNCHR